MIIYPAMDLMDGSPVRLKQGRFDEATFYSPSPLDALRQFAAAGASWVHVVDLDGARSGAPVQHELIASLAAMASLRLQVAGGFRERSDVQKMLDAGAARVVVGSLAVTRPQQVRGWINEFGAERIVLSLDVRLAARTPMVRISGWTETTGLSLFELASMFPEARHLLITDIARDGMLKGPNVALYEEIARRLPHVEVQASGGVSSLTDLERLPTAGVIIGKALWDGCFKLEEAIHLARA